MVCGPKAHVRPLEYYIMNPFSKTSYGKAPNYNNFFGDGDFEQYVAAHPREQKRNSSTANSGKLRSDKYTPLMKKIK